MKISEILSPYKYFFIAEKKDNQDILNFFNSITMDTKDLSLRYDRGVDFFQFASEQASRNIIFIIRDEQNLVKGTASISFIPHYYNGKKEIFAYLGDLRIAPTLSAKIRINWKKCYSQIIEHFQSIEEFSGVHYLYTAILDDNQNAMRSLLKNNDQLIYHKLTNYETFNVLQQKPLSFFSHNSKYKCQKIDFLEAENFLNELDKTKGLFPYFNQQEDSELNRHVNEWESFSKDSFMGVLDQNNKLLAVFAPWMCQSKKLIIEKMGPKQKALSFISPFLGIPSLNENKAINALYLTHLYFKEFITVNERQDLLIAILKHTLTFKRTFHVISFFTYPEWNLDMASWPFLTENTKAQFFQVMNKKQFEEKDFINLQSKPPAFEIGIA